MKTIAQRMIRLESMTDSYMKLSNKYIGQGK